LQRHLAETRVSCYNIKVKTATACILSCVAFATIAAGPPRKIAFGHDGHIWVANIDGTAKKKLVVGGAPMLSPDGARIAFDSTPSSAYENAARGADNPKTQITVLDIASGKLTLLKDIPGDNCLDPAWSPDGKWIAFQARRESPGGRISDLAVVKEDGTGFNIIKKGEEPLESAFNRPCWARDGRSIFYHDTKNIYRLGLDGVVLGQWEVSKIVPVDYLTSGGRIDVSPDGNRLLLTVDYRKNSDAPPPSLWSFDLTTQSAKRLNTPKELWIVEGCWLDNQNILFATGSPDGSAGPIYRISIDGTNLKRLIKDARGVSVSSGD
jgi:TolB protein